MDYHDQLIDVKQAVDLVRSGDFIVTGLGASAADTFFGHLHEASGRLRDVLISSCLLMREYPCINDPEYSTSFLHESWFYSGASRKAHTNANTTYVPGSLHSYAKKRLDYRKPDFYVGAASMPDSDGYVSLSCSNAYEKQMIEAAETAILEINPNYPRTLGDVRLHVSLVDHLIQTDYEVPSLPDVPPSDRDRVIGSLIASHIHHGDCLQLGIGGMPNALAEALMDKEDLGIHTEMLTTNMMKLFKAGVITGRRKQIHRGKIVCTFIMGSKELYAFAHENTTVEVLAGSYVNDPYVIGRNDNMVSINSTMEVDLTGQCASESLGSAQFSGTGGQADTAVGAQNAKNGRSFICLYSTASVRNPVTGVYEEKSKIVPHLIPGAAVTLSRNDVDYVVTEYGVAWLRGRSIRERAGLLIGIAHPRFRDELRYKAIELGMIPGASDSPNPTPNEHEYP